MLYTWLFIAMVPKWEQSQILMCKSCVWKSPSMHLFFGHYKSFLQIISSNHFYNLLLQTITNDCVVIPLFPYYHYHTSMLPSFQASKLPSYASICPDFNDSMIPWFHDFMFPWFSKIIFTKYFYKLFLQMLSTNDFYNWFLKMIFTNDSMIPWFHDSMIPWTNESMN